MKQVMLSCVYKYKLFFKDQIIASSNSQIYYKFRRGLKSKSNIIGFVLLHSMFTIITIRF